MKLVFMLSALIAAVAIGCEGLPGPEPPDSHYSIIAQRPQEFDLKEKSDSYKELESVPFASSENINSNLVRDVDETGEVNCLKKNTVSCFILNGSCVVDKLDCTERLVLGECSGINCHCCVPECPDGFIAPELSRSQHCYKLFGTKTQYHLRTLEYPTLFHTSLHDVMVPGCYIIEEGEEPVYKVNEETWTPDSCNTKTCVGGSVYTKNTCCTINGEGDETVTKENGDTWNTDDCTTKTCVDGSVTTTHTCCTITEGGVTETKENGDTWDTGDCTTKTCVDGSVTTTHTCCITDDGTTKELGSKWPFSTATDECFELECQDGVISEKQLINNKCCAVGVDLYINGEEWPYDASPVGCFVNRCHNGQKQENRLKSNECCKVEGVIYENGMTISTDECYQYICQNGERESTLIPNKCCEEYENADEGIRTHENGETATSTDECYEFTCQDGIIPEPHLIDNNCCVDLDTGETILSGDTYFDETDQKTKKCVAGDLYVIKG